MGAFDEQGYLSCWSINHFLAGYVPHLIFVYTRTSIAAWVSLFVVTLGALGFELVENNRNIGVEMWRWLGYSPSSYAPDTVFNSITDVICAEFGWLTVQIVSLVSTSTAVLGVLLGVAGALFVTWAVLFSIERRTVLLPAAPQPVRIAPAALRPFK